MAGGSDSGIGSELPVNKKNPKFSPGLRRSNRTLALAAVYSSKRTQTSGEMGQVPPAGRDPGVRVQQWEAKGPPQLT